MEGLRLREAKVRSRRRARRPRSSAKVRLAAAAGHPAVSKRHPPSHVYLRSATCHTSRGGAAGCKGQTVCNSWESIPAFGNMPHEQGRGGRVQRSNSLQQLGEYPCMDGTLACARRRVLHAARQPASQPASEPASKASQPASQMASQPGSRSDLQAKQLIGEPHRTHVFPPKALPPSHPDIHMLRPDTLTNSPWQRMRLRPPSHSATRVRRAATGAPPRPRLSAPRPRHV
eukprot:364491-Chlamydomonas_euryale.AAC.15